MKHSFAFQAPKYTVILTTHETWQGKLMDLWGEIRQESLLVEQIQIKINHNSLLTGNCNFPPKYYPDNCLKSLLHFVHADMASKTL